MAISKTQIFQREINKINKEIEESKHIISLLEGYIKVEEIRELLYKFEENKNGKN